MKLKPLYSFFRRIYWKIILSEKFFAYSEKNNFFTDKKQNVLIEAAQVSSSTRVINALLQKGYDINEADDEGYTPIMHAATRNKSVKVLETLLQNGADLHKTSPQGLPPLIMAAHKNANPDIVATLIRYGANPNVKSQGGEMTAMIAVLFNPSPKKVIAKLIENGADPNITDIDGNTPLIIAIGIDLFFIRILIFINKAPNLDLNLQNNAGQSPLALAVCNPSEEMMKITKILIKRGADVNAKNKTDGSTPLMCAVRKLNVNAVKLLLKKGADVNAADKDGKTPLMHAVYAAGTRFFRTEYIPRDNPPGCSQTFRQALKIARLLIKKGADVNKALNDGKTPLLVSAAIHPYPHFMKLFIKHGADVNAKDDLGETALSLMSMFFKNPDVAKLLIKNGADVHARNKGGRTPLICACVGFGHPKPSVIKLMIAKGADVNAKDKTDGSTPLMCAVRKLNVNAVKLLLKKGADVNAADKDGKTPLMHAVYAAGTRFFKTEYIPRDNPPGCSQTFRQALKIARLLIKKGADVNKALNDGKTPLLVSAAIHPYPHFMKLFIKHGADVNAKDDLGETALSLMSMFFKNPDVAKLLIKHGADVHARNKGGRTPLICACVGFGHPKPSVIKLMIAKGADINAKDNDGKTALEYVKDDSWELIYPKILKELISLLTPAD